MFGEHHQSELDIAPEVLNILQPLLLRESDYVDIMNLLEHEMNKGLAKATHNEASVKMFPSYVTQLPTGNEIGQYLAIDLGGTNYRILLATLAGDRKEPIIKETTYAIPPLAMTGTGEDLFDYIADNLYEFTKLHGISEKKLKLGFTFSFPCEQKGLNSSYLIHWTKGFSATGVEGHDVARLLQEAMDRKKINAKCVAVVNDTVGTLTACSLKDPKCAIGLIVGTGCNAAYIEEISRVETYREEELNIRNASGEITTPEHVIINMEWGAFGCDGSLEKYSTIFDKILDSESLYPGKQIYEKMISGMYIGELVRIILVYLANKKLLFKTLGLPESLANKNSFHSKYISECERDPVNLYYSTNYMLTEDLQVPVVELEDSRIVRYVCEIVAARSAYLVGAGVACLLNRLQRKELTVGVDGSLFKFHPKFPERMTAMIHRLTKMKTKFFLRLSEDGSGKGAAAIAATSPS